MVKHKAEHQAYNKFCLVYDARNTIKCLRFMNGWNKIQQEMSRFTYS